MQAPDALLSPTPPVAHRTAGAAANPGFDITHGPSFAMLRVDLAPGQTLVSEAGAMVARDAGVRMEVKTSASPSAGLWATIVAFLVAFVRRFVAGESFFVNHFSSDRGGAVWLAPSMSGGISHRALQGSTITLSRGAFLASMGNVETNVKFGGLTSLLSREGLFMLECSGDGELWFNSYGGIHAVEVDGSFLVDNGHLVGFEGDLSWSIASAGGGLMGLVASGEGLVCEFRGRGRVYLQSRNMGAFVGWISPLMPG